MRFQRGHILKEGKTDEVVPSVRISCTPIGPGNKFMSGNISMSRTVKNARVSDVMKAIEKALFTK